MAAASFFVSFLALGVCATVSGQQTTFFTDSLPRSFESSAPAAAAARSWEGSSSSNSQPRQDGERYFTVASSISKLSLDLGRCSSSLCASNAVFSPLSLSSALSLLLLGAGGTTYSQLRDALAYARGVDDDRIHQSFQLVLDRLAGIDKVSRDSLILNIANAVFIQKDLHLFPNYQLQARNYYRSDIRQLDFVRAPVSSTAEINQWVSARTNRKINNILTSPVPQSTRVIIANAIYFNANWEEPFPITETHPGDFFISENERIRVNMMSNVLELPYLENTNLGFRAIGLPYKGDHIGMFIILPLGSNGLAALNELEAKLTPDVVDSIIPNTVVKSVLVELPRFRIEQRILLKNALRNLGVSDLFSTSANLTRLMDETGVGLDDVIHQTVIEVNEQGTEAASATVPMLRRDAPQKTFRVNQPFLFFIQDIASGVKIFWGRVVRPDPLRGLNF